MTISIILWFIFCTIFGFVMGWKFKLWGLVIASITTGILGYVLRISDFFKI